ncbi:hypothetical protein JZ751_029883 [Albula glossodonta]|uniref:Uncharacterized protein n=1 Tax=Albula glossodonta TaxID=121402 RepID=A0A8T2NAQ8_9TELE|nr:hypothetical protein JZ751_029883 [Albula glossodonta]
MLCWRGRLLVWRMLLMVRPSWGLMVYLDNSVTKMAFIITMAMLPSAYPRREANKRLRSLPLAK